MTKSLLAGTAAVVLIASAAWAQDATVTQTSPVGSASTTTTRLQKTTDPLTGATTERTETTRSVAPAASTTTTTVVNPDAFNPTRVTTYHEERNLAPGPQTVEKTYTTQSSDPATQTTTYSRTTTTTGPSR